MRGPEIPGGHIVIDGDRITAVGARPAPDPGPARRFDASGCLVTPGLVNTHHHVYQWATQGLYQDATLFEWLVELYPVWAPIDAETCWAAARRASGPTC